MSALRVHTLGTDDKPGTLLRIVVAPPSEGTTVIHALGSSTVGPCERALFVSVPAFSRLPGEGESEPVPCVFVPVADAPVDALLALGPCEGYADPRRPWPYMAASTTPGLIDDGKAGDR